MWYCAESCVGAGIVFLCLMNGVSIFRSTVWFLYDGKVSDGAKIDGHRKAEKAPMSALSKGGRAHDAPAPNAATLAVQGNVGQSLVRPPQVTSSKLNV
jgi:hypothetical protein